MDIDLLYISLLMNVFTIICVLMRSIDKLPFIKKRKLSKAKVRLNNHIAERKKLMREIRQNSKPLHTKRTIYMFPWWPWFK